jgi:hypothetical protein
MSNYSKITSYALSMTFSSEKAPLLTEICEATPNAIMAIEKLLGIYEVPFIEPSAHADCEKSYIDKEFVSYDIWNNRVNFKAKRNRANEGEAPNYKECTNYCSLKSWNEGGW